MKKNKKEVNYIRDKYNVVGCPICEHSYLHKKRGYHSGASPERRCFLVNGSVEGKCDLFKPGITA